LVLRELKDAGRSPIILGNLSNVILALAEKNQKSPPESTVFKSNVGQDSGGLYFRRVKLPSSQAIRCAGRMNRWTNRVGINLQSTVMGLLRWTFTRTPRNWRKLRDNAESGFQERNKVTVNRLPQARVERDGGWDRGED
jgi:hypothetical protein